MYEVKSNTAIAHGQQPKNDGPRLEGTLSGEGTRSPVDTQTCPFIPPMTMMMMATMMIGMIMVTINPAALTRMVVSLSCAFTVPARQQCEMAFAITDRFDRTFGCTNSRGWLTGEAFGVPIATTGTAPLLRRWW